MEKQTYGNLIQSATGCRCRSRPQGAAKGSGPAGLRRDLSAHLAVLPDPERVDVVALLHHLVEDGLRGGVHVEHAAALRCGQGVCVVVG